MRNYTVVSGLFVVALVMQFMIISVFNRIKAQVRAGLPDSETIPDWGPSWLRGTVLKLHRKLYPSSSLRRKLYIVWAVQVTAFVSAVLLVVTFVGY